MVTILLNFADNFARFFDLNKFILQLLKRTSIVRTIIRPTGSITPSRRNVIFKKSVPFRRYAMYTPIPLKTRLIILSKSNKMVLCIQVVQYDMWYALFRHQKIYKINIEVM